METIFLPVPGLWLMFLLGLRHGFDPDHIAMIDNMAYRAPARPSRLAPWVGGLFALGHGLAVTVIAVLLNVTTSGIAVPPLVRGVLAWLPVALLVYVGILNLRQLLGNAGYRPHGWKTGFLPSRLRTSSHPLAPVAIGVLFALVFDTATQAAAWSYAATAHGGATLALLAGLAFTAGMVVTDTADSQLMVRLLRRTAGLADALAYRRAVGWIVVLMSFAMAAYGAAEQLSPGAGLSEGAATATGGLLLLGVLAGYVVARRRRRLA